MRYQSAPGSATPPRCRCWLPCCCWSLLAQYSEGLPGPLSTWQAALVLFADPFYDNGPNDMGIGWNILNSLGRVGVGFGLRIPRIQRVVVVDPARHVGRRVQRERVGRRDDLDDRRH